MTKMADKKTTVVTIIMLRIVDINTTCEAGLSEIPSRGSPATFSNIVIKMNPAPELKSNSQFV
jgi:hypothetical protein